MSARNFRGLAHNSRAYLALVKLQSIGSTAGLNAWMRAVAWEASAKSFNIQVVDKLIEHKAIVQTLAAYTVSEEGHQILGTPVDAPVATPPAVATARYVAPIRPLQSKNIVRLVETRPGALDYLNVPSRIGDTRLMHGEKSVSLKSGGGAR